MPRRCRLACEAFTSGHDFDLEVGSIYCAADYIILYTLHWSVVIRSHLVISSIMHHGWIYFTYLQCVLNWITHFWSGCIHTFYPRIIALCEVLFLIKLGDSIMGTGKGLILWEWFLHDLIPILGPNLISLCGLLDSLTLTLLKLDIKVQVVELRLKSGGTNMLVCMISCHFCMTWIFSVISFVCCSLLSILKRDISITYILLITHRTVDIYLLQEFNLSMMWKVKWYTHIHMMICMYIPIVRPGL